MTHIFSLPQIYELMGDNRDKETQNKTINNEAESDILRKIDLAFQVT